MKYCSICNKTFENIVYNCPVCNTGPGIIDGFTAYAPDLAHNADGFESHYFPILAELEADNFWFQARNTLIVWALQKYCRNFKSFFEVGCGTGYVLMNISKAFPNVKMYGSELFTEGLAFSKKRMPKATLMQMDARSIPFREEFDVIGIFDVLEHIKEDELVLSQIYKALKPKGFIVLTVPQHTWLWSQTDDYAHHVRRYRAKELREKLHRAGFEILRNTSFVTTLLPAMMISRLLKKTSGSEEFDATAELKISPWLNKLFLWCLKAEFVLIKNHINFLMGGSRLIVAKRG